MSKFKLSDRSKSRMQGVHPHLVAVVNRAIEITEVDFGITEGLRTAERQKELVTAGASKTMNSRHLTGHAVDLVAYIGTHVRWDWPLYTKLAKAMKKAAEELNTPIVWGGCWTVINKEPDLIAASAAYVARKRAKGEEPLVDGPHFELWKGMYE